MSGLDSAPAVGVSEDGTRVVSDAPAFALAYVGAVVDATSTLCRKRASLHRERMREAA